MKPKLVIRADGGTAIGMGHIIRSLALADMLKHDFQIMFAVQQPSEHVIRAIHKITETIFHLPLETDPEKDVKNLAGFLDPSDIVLLDGYEFRTDYQKTIKAKGCKLVAIDDLHSWHHVADMIINHAATAERSDYSAEPYTKYLLGPDYALLRAPFLEKKEIRAIAAIKNVFISMGAADANNITQKFCEALTGIQGIGEIHLMLGAANPHLGKIDELIAKSSSVKIHKHFDISADELVSLLQKCDVAICPASSISMECCATGIGLLSGYTADNQKGILRGLIQNKVAISLGDLNLLSISAIQEQFSQLAIEDLNDLVRQQSKYIDGKSPERFRTAFAGLRKEPLHFRMATPADTDFYFIWTNDPLVRAQSYNQSQVKYEDHVKWFNAKLSSGTCFFYLFLNAAEKPVGQVRIDTSGKETVIGISVDPDFRGKGLAADMLSIAGDDFLTKNPDATITAYIKIGNDASYNSFLKAGFGNEETVTEQGIPSHKLFRKKA
ncbi:MAG: UDP-2,4-diacetamido-2,4,6-trideoxy-beta-L-altropyranose hydrolase [Bacteroidia bacterium]